MSFEKLTDDHSPSTPEVFLDTSIHCSKLKGPLFQSRISDVLKRFQWKGGSTYSKVEFGNVVLSNVEYYLTTIQKRGSLSAALDWIGNVLPTIGKNTPKSRWAFNLLINHSGRTEEEKTERALCSLRRLMKHGVRFVEDMSDQMVDGTRCFWAAKGVERTKHGNFEWKTPICYRTNKRCEIDEFFEKNREYFEKIKLAIDSMPEEEKSEQLAGFSTVITQALIDPQCLLDYKTGCKRLADAIIAVESANFKNLFSQNAAESKLLCSLFEQTFYYLPPNPEKGVLVQLSPPQTRL